MIKTLLIYLLTCVSITSKKDIKEISLTAESMSQTLSQELKNESLFYSITFSDEQLFKENSLFLTLESKSQNIRLKIYDTSEFLKLTEENVILELITYSGNIALAMSNTFFNEKFDFFRKNKQLYFSLDKDEESEDSIPFSLTAQISQNLKLPLNKSFTTRLDQSLKSLDIEWTYSSESYPQLRKLRFQAVAVLYKDTYTMSSMLHSNQESYQMNSLFKNLVGGVLDSENFELCKGDCVYRMSLSFNGVKVANLESFAVEDVEDLSIFHFGEFYDKVYQQNQSSFYRLKYVPEIEGLDVSVSLIPVTGNTGLYVNPKTKPLKFENYAFRASGPLAKRLTIRSEELKEMNALKQDLFIAVQSHDQGEFLLKIDAHENDYRGRLSAGISEQGYVKGKEMASYLYSFQVYQTQEINFTASLNIFSGEADLYVRECKSLNDCSLTPDDLSAESSLLKAENNDNFKAITHSFTCRAKHKHAQTPCNFMIGAYGREDHKTHYELAIRENRFHTLLTPGHEVVVKLYPDEIRFFKFSYPGGSETGSQLFLQVEPEWGSFALYLDKKQEFPTTENSQYSEEFLQHESNLYASTRSLNLNTLLNDFSEIGPYYIGLRAKTNSALTLKFFQKNQHRFAVHTLQAGRQQKGVLSNTEEIVYYMISLSLEESKASTVSIDLVPIKGEFVMFAARGGKLPSKESNEIISTNDHLDLKYKNYESHHEYIIGVQARSTLKNENIDFTFTITLSYKDKATKLSPGVLSSFQAKEQNYFQIDVLEDMEELLILKGINDGYNLLLCAQFNKAFNLDAEKNCEQSADNKEIGIFFNQSQIQEKCKKQFDQQIACLLYISVSGYADQKFTIGYTFNKHPFKLSKGQIVQGPAPRLAEQTLRFIYHCEKGKPVALYFNAKGKPLRIFSKLVSQENLRNQDQLEFPNEASQDTESKLVKGHISTILYTGQQISEKGDSPEILLTIVNPKEESSTRNVFDMNNGFIIQTFTDNKEILRTQVHQEHLFEEEWYYYNFYNNGSEDLLDIYANSNHASLLTILLARDKDAQPPFNQRPLAKQTGVGQVHIQLTPQELRDSASGSNSTKGYFTIAVKSSNACLLNIYWNNKKDLNYIELTPGIPATMHLHQNKPLFFHFYAQENLTKDLNGKISLHWKSDSHAEIFLLKSITGQLLEPSKEDHQFRSSLGKSGGIAVLEILPSDSHYCIECSYIGKVESKSEGQIMLMASVEHARISNTLTTGFNYPDMVEAQQGKTYRYLNLDEESFFINLSLLTGQVNIFVDTKETVSQSQNIQSFYSGKDLSNHVHVEVRVSELGIKANQDVFIRVENSKLDNAAFTLNIFKNSLSAPLEPGVPRALELKPSQTSKLFFKNKYEAEGFELRATLKRVANRENEEQALRSLQDLVSLTYEDQNSPTLVQHSSKKIIHNKVYLEFDSQMQKNGIFYFLLKNPFDFPIFVQLDLIQGKNALVNLNDSIIDHNFGKEASVYEAYGQLGRFWFMDLKVCYGEVLTRFYEGDYSKVGSTDFSQYKSVKDSNSIAHYFQLKSNKVFVEIQNKDTKTSVYSMTFYNEQDLNDNPYSDLRQSEDGRVKIHTDKNSLNFEPLKIKNYKNEDFIHKVTYRAYLSPDFKIMRFLKNCNEHLIDKIFVKPQFKTREKIFYYKDTKEFNKETTVSLFFNDLDYNVKYYGVVVVDVELLPAEEGWIDPIRSQKSYYDEFIFVSTKLNVPISLLTGALLVLVLFYIIYQVIKNYIFSEIYEVQQGKSLSRFKNLTNDIFGVNSQDILESDFEIEDEIKLDRETPLDTDKEIELGGDDRTTPLDINQ